jgi:hypothetical protein
LNEKETIQKEYEALEMTKIQKDEEIFNLAKIHNVE